MSIITFALTRRAENFRIRAEFEAEAMERASAVEKSIESKFVLMASLRSFVRSQERLDRRRFRMFVEPLLARVHGIQALAWLPRVRDADRARFEAAARRDGLRGFQITERNAQGQMVRASRREEYFPALLIEPYRGNEPALGFDSASGPIRRLALHRARDTGEPSATEPISLVRDEPGRMGFVTHWAVYEQNVSIDTVEARRRHLRGFASGIFYVSSIVEDALEHLDHAGIDIHVFDTSDPAGAGSLLYRHASRLARSDPDTARRQSKSELRDMMHHMAVVDVGGRQWSIVCTPMPSFVRVRRTWYPWAGLAAGLLMTALLTAYLVKTGRAAETLRESEARYQDLYDNAPDMCASVDAKTATVLQCNNTVAMALGCSKEDIVGRSIFDMYHPDCMDEVEKVFQTFVRTGKVHNAELQLKRKDGSKLDVSLNVSAVRDEQGQVLYSRSVMRDITDHKRAEAEREDLAKFPSENPQPVMRIDADGVVLYANAASRPILEARDSNVGRTAPQDWRDLVTRALGAGELQETEVVHADRTFSFQVSPITEAGYTNWYGRDITARKNAQEAVQRAQPELLNQQRARQRAEAELAKIRDELVRTTQLAAIGQLSVSIAHDLRNPLGSARNAVYYLKRRLVADRPEITEYLDIIDQEIDASDRIIESLLTAARTREPVRQQVDLRQIVEEVFEKGRWAPGVRCRLVLDPDPFVLEADPDQLRQVLRNLLTNAVQAMQDGGELLVDASRGPDGDTIIFRDTGPGVPAETRDSLFEPLVTSKAKGIGLGLTICRQIIKRHNGTIELIDDSGQGAAFRIRLPRPKR